MNDQFRNDGVRPDSLQDSGNTRQSINEPEPVALAYDTDLLGIIEQALKGLQGYGIMALELIQNADNAGAGFLSFDVCDDALVVRNNETFSSCGLKEPQCPWSKTGDPEGLKRPCNFHAISRIGSRSKLKAVEQTGRFGIGFVSVYQITDTPIIRSAGIELRLDPQTGRALQTKVAHATGSEFRLPWASARSEVRDGLNASPTPPDVAEKVVKEIDEVLSGSLLFLRHLERVELLRQGERIVTVDIKRGSNEITLHFSPKGVMNRTGFAGG